MSFAFRPLLVLALVLLVPCPAFACFWDHDTFYQERNRFPSTLELITGKFLRHSKEFYEWRIQDRLDKLKTKPNNLAYYDDLAVAYQMTGQHEKAVETILKKEKIRPGLYETYSNLGTFYILEGKFEKGLPYIDKALAINPNAHFGREKYQKWLVEYALTKRRNGKVVFPLRPTGADSSGFDEFVAERLGKPGLSDDDRRDALKGVEGMMRFANYANPLLLEALGDLLNRPVPGSVPGSRRLAARCYLKASYEMTDPTSQQQYRVLATGALERQNDLTLEDVELALRNELRDADTWYKELRKNERQWIADGKNADAEFDKLYTNSSPEVKTVDDEAGMAKGKLVRQWITVGAMVGVAILIVLILRLWWRQRKASGNLPVIAGDWPRKVTSRGQTPAGYTVRKRQK